MTDSSTPASARAADQLPYVFDKMQHVSRRRMPTLELIHERFARTARLTLFNMVRRSVEVDVKLPELKPYSTFVAGFPERTNINLVNIRPLRASSMISSAETITGRSSLADRKSSSLPSVSAVGFHVGSRQSRRLLA